MPPAPAPQPYRRRIRLIRPRLQLRLILTFLGAGMLGLFLQYLLMAASLVSLADALPQDGPVLMGAAGEILLESLAISLGVLLPVVFFLGLWATHRFAGPIFRFEAYLRQVARGERPADCRLRKGDELQELCALINEATRPLRGPGAAPPAEATPAHGEIPPPLPSPHGSGVA